MATHDDRSTTLGDFDLDATLLASEHSPSLHASERFVRCRTCRVTVPYTITAEVPIRRALAELDDVPCDSHELPDVPVGDHVPTIASRRPEAGLEVRCESCGRSGPLHGDDEQVLRDLGTIPCSDGLTHRDLVDLLVSPTRFTPRLPELGISNWTGRPGDRHGPDVERLFRHERFQYCVYLCETDDAYAARLNASPDASSDPLAELPLSSADPADPATRDAVETLVTFLGATDPLRAREFAELHRAYEDALERHRDAWLQEAYESARERFADRHGGTPEAFADAFAGSVEDPEEGLRRMVGSGGFEDPGPDAFAVEMLGHGHEFPGFFSFVADLHTWSPPVPDA